MAELNDPQFRDRVMEQFVSLWLNPEIARRKAAGLLPPDFAVYAAQVILDPGTEPPKIRFNEEVKFLVKGSFTKEVRANDPVCLNEIKDIERIDLTEEDMNCGHASMMLSLAGWHCTFDFRYNAGRIKTHLDAASEYIEVADFSLDNKFFGPFVETLWSAVELLAKGQLLAEVDQKALSSKKHNYLVSKLNLLGHHQRTERRWAVLLNRLTELRPQARYLEGDLELGTDEAKQMLADAKDMLAFLSSYARVRQIG